MYSLCDLLSDLLSDLLTDLLTDLFYSEIQAGYIVSRVSKIRADTNNTSAGTKQPDTHLWSQGKQLLVPR